MISEIHWINEAKIGKNQLGTMARPRGNDWLEGEIQGLKDREIDCLVSLLERDEEWELGLEDEAATCRKSGIEFIGFPIKDVHTPVEDDQFIKLAKALAEKIRENQKVVVHCRMGIGRASMLAAATMINLGIEGEDVFEIISKYRKLKVPDTEAQKSWVLSLETKLQKEQ